MIITRIYQGKITKAEWKDGSFSVSPESALKETHCLFQDAVNYHLVALAGMAKVEDDKTIGGKFRRRLASIWSEHPKNNLSAGTLQDSLRRTLMVPSSDSLSFDEAVERIFKGTEYPDRLPIVLQYVLNKMGKGEGTIRKAGCELLPKLCSADFKGNFDYSPMTQAAANGSNRLRAELQNPNDTDAIVKLASEMNLSWVGIKTPPNEAHTESLYSSEDETKLRVGKILQELNNDEKLPESWKQIFREENVDWPSVLADFRQKWQQMKSPRCLQKNNKCDIKRRNAAVLLMYFPCSLTAKLLKRCMFKDASGKARGDQQSDSDVLMETRGRRGFVYPGYSALPLWEDTKPIADVMCDKKWDILAFKEALKCIHGFELKMTERVEEKEVIQKRIDYMEGKSTQKPKKVGDEDDETLFVLKGDARYDLLMKLLDEIKADVGMDEDGEYSLFVRALRGWDGLREKWIDNPRNAEGECAKQEKGGKLGSAVLFKRLCTDKYRFIWEGRPATEKQADDILCAYAALQQLRQKVKCLEEPVHITAAEPIFSPRALTYSDWDSSKKTGIFGAEEEGRIDLPVLVHGTQNKLKKQIVRAWFAAPRLKKDELGVNLGKWMSEKKCDWLQPMMSALGVEEKVKLKKKAAVTLALGISDQAKAPDLLLNFPVTLDVSHLREAIGKAKLWDKQFNGVTSEKLHLHWPSSNPALQNAWWNKTDVKENGFIVLGIDLGVRSGSAYSVVKVRSGRDKQGMKTKSGKVYQGRFLGETDGEPWYGYAVKQGILRMDGEGGKFCVARKPIPEEMKLLQRLRCKVDMTPGAWPINTVWDVQKEALYGFRMYLSRFRRYVWCANHLRQEQSIQWDKLEKYLS